MLKRFVVFTGYKDQVQGGLDSIDSDYDSLEEAIDYAKKLTHHIDAWDDPNYDGDYDEKDDDDDYDSDLWCEVVDTDERKVIGEFGYETP